MKYLKLFLISVVVFGVMLFCISLLFPSNTIVSRAVNVKNSKGQVQEKMFYLYTTAFNDSLSFKMLRSKVDSVLRLTGEEALKGVRRFTNDTLLFTSPFAAHIQQGVALYDLHNDSTAVQVFYKIHVPTYKFWDKFGLMLNETKYGPSLDSAVKRIEEVF